MRAAVGSVFVYAGFMKLIEPVENLKAVIEVHPAMPAFAVPVIAVVLPWMEFIFGAFMLLGYAPVLSAWVLGFLSVCFLVMLSISRFVFGVALEDCGCFGESGIQLTVLQVLILDGAMLAMCVRLAVMKSCPFSLDRILGGRTDD